MFVRYPCNEYTTSHYSPNTGGPKELATILARERAPIDSDEEMFVNQTEKSTVGNYMSNSVWF